MSRKVEKRSQDNHRGNCSNRLGPFQYSEKQIHLLLAFPSWSLMVLHRHRHLHCRLRRRKNPNSTPEPHSMVQYLIDSCDLSPESESKACVHLHNNRSPSDPDSILRFFKQIGFGNGHVAKLVSKDPWFLFTNLDKTLKPKLALLHDLGLSEPEIAELVSESTCFLWFSDL